MLVSALHVSGILIMTPFALIGMAVIQRWRRYRFPFGIAGMRSSIAAVYPDRRVARAYLNGIIDGYWTSAPEMWGWSRVPPYQWGVRDGERLRSGELAPEAIPTHQAPFAFPAAVSLSQVRT